MLLIGVKKENGWLLSQWELTYPTGWERICKAGAAVYDYYEDPEILVCESPMAENHSVNIQSKEDILNIEESSLMTIRGFSKIIKVPLMMTIYNQTKIVNVAVPADGDEFKIADYEKFNKSLCAYMDSVELFMHGLG